MRSVVVSLMLLLSLSACIGDPSSEQPAPDQEVPTSTGQGESLSAAAEVWCEGHFGGVSAAASRMPRGVASLQLVDETPPAVQAAKSLNQPPERLIELWKDADLASWNSNCSSAYSALGDLAEEAWRFCHDNASELGSVAYSMGFADIVSGSLRAEVDSAVESADEKTRSDGYARLALYLWLVDFGEWEEACLRAQQTGS